MILIARSQAVRRRANRDLADTDEPARIGTMGGQQS